MHNLWTVVRFEVVRAIKKKSFWLSILAFPALIGLIIGMTFFSNQAADDAAQKAASEKFSLAVLDDSGLIEKTLLSAMDAQVVSSRQNGIDLVRDGRKEAFFYYPKDIATTPVEVYGQDIGLAKNGRYETVAKQLLTLSQRDKFSDQQIAVVQGAVKTNMVTYQDGQIAPGFERAIAPGLVLVLFYITFVLMAGRMLASATEEKENRVIEMLLSTVMARTLVVGKIISLFLLGLIQVVAIALPVIAMVWLARDYIDIPSIDVSKIVIDPAVLLLQLVIFICAYMLFTGILVAIGSAVPTAKEASSFMGVAMFGLFIPLYAVQAIIADPSQLIVKIFTYVPLTSPITLLLRNAAGNLSLIEVVGGVALLAISAVLALWVATRTFGYGTLEYSRKLSWRELLGKR